MFISALRFYLPTLLGCLTDSDISSSDPECFDYRYFYPDRTFSFGNCTCGLARQAGAVVIRTESPGLLVGNVWLQALRAFKDNPSVIGFLVEQACLSAISRTGFSHGSINWESFPATLFQGDLIQAIPTTGDSEKFFIPKDPFFRDIDALYLKLDDQNKTALVVPIQITVSKDHADSEARFYSRWTQWLAHLAGFQVTTAFVWIVENHHSWKVIQEEFRTTRNRSTRCHPTHEQIVITVAEISRTLGQQLASIRKLP